MVFGDFAEASVHLLLADGSQRSPRQLQSAHNGLKALKGQRRVVVVHLDYPAGMKTAEEDYSSAAFKVGLFQEFMNYIAIKAQTDVIQAFIFGYIPW